MYNLMMVIIEAETCSW